MKLNQIRNCPVTEKDVDLAKKTFVPGIPTLKGKSVQGKPVQMIDDVIQIPKEILRLHSDIHLCMDLMFVSKVGFLTTIGYPIFYRKVKRIDNRTKESLYNNLDAILHIYNSGGYKVSRISCDQEFKCLMDDVKDKLDVKMTYAGLGDHEPHSERNNRALNNQTRVGLHRTTYKTIPRLMIEHLVIGSTDKFNLFPARNGVSDY